MRWSWGRLGLVCLLAAGLVLGYSLIPVESGKPVTATSIVLFVVGLAGFSGVVLVLAVRRQRGTSSANTRLQVGGLIALIIGMMLFFAATYYRMAKSPGQFADLTTGIDALYFAISTTLTVGFGDVHATGQLARVLVIIQMVFTVTVLGVAARLLAHSLRNPTRRPLEHHRGVGSEQEAPRASE